jgi:dTDP-4-dehydrorhamnose 3,5-epimerase
MSHFILQSTPIDGLQVIKRKTIDDARGFFARIFCQETLSQYLQGKTIRHINHSLTQHKGAVRGLHFQHPPHAEIKIVTCLKGQVWDVAVDLRQGSPTFLQYHSVKLSEDNHHSYLIPEGFAHGFQTLTSNCEMLYLHTAEYNPEAEGALNALDPRLAIDWPDPITVRSKRDTGYAMLTDYFYGIAL